MYLYTYGYYPMNTSCMSAISHHLPCCRGQKEFSSPHFMTLSGIFCGQCGGQSTGILPQGYNPKLMTKEDVNVSTSIPTTVSMRNKNTTPKKSTSPPLVTDLFLTVHIAQHYLIQQKLGSHLEYRVCTIPLSRYLWCTLHGGPHQTNEETPVQMGLACKRGITQNCTSFLCATNGQI